MCIIKDKMINKTSPMRQPMEARSIEANNPASVPSALIAPSVPVGTTLNVVTRHLLKPHKCEIIDFLQSIDKTKD
jgi:hypothetical protein